MMNDAPQIHRHVDAVVDVILLQRASLRRVVVEVADRARPESNAKLIVGGGHGVAAARRRAPAATSICSRN
jgi:hypothetical protein